jgi:hypothetical protein
MYSEYQHIHPEVKFQPINEIRVVNVCLRNHTCLWVLQVFKILHEVDPSPLAVVSWFYDEGWRVATLELSLKFIALAGQQEGLGEEIVFIWMVLLHDRQIFSHFVLMGEALDSGPLTQPLMRL